MKEPDATSISFYLTKDINRKMTFGPAWDYDISMGNNHHPDGLPLPEKWFVKGKDFVKPLFKDKSFTDAYIARWKELRKTVFRDENINRIIDTYEYQLSLAQPRDNAKWDVIGTDVKFGNDDIGQLPTWKAEVDYMRDFLLTRSAWIDENIDGLVSLYK